MGDEVEANLMKLRYRDSPSQQSDTTMSTQGIFSSFNLFAQLLLFFGACDCLKDLRVSVPLAIRKGETAVFLCDFNLEDDQLYAVKWYKGRKEFYRFTPKDENPIKTFHLDHIHVDKNKSNMTQLTLLRVSPSLSGIYNCEVSAESPSFHTILASGEMTVVEIPRQEPTIEGLKQKYRVSESLDVICTAGASRPAANITWFINGDKAQPEHVHLLTPLPDFHDETLSRSRSQLRFSVKSHTFSEGYLTIRCTATILNIYQSTVELRANEASLLESEIVVLVNNFDPNQDIGRGKSWRLQATAVISTLFGILPILLRCYVFGGF